MDDLDQQILIFVQTGKTWEEIRKELNYPDSQIACRLKKLQEVGSIAASVIYAPVGCRIFIKSFSLHPRVLVASLVINLLLTIWIWIIYHA